MDTGTSLQSFKLSEGWSPKKWNNMEKAAMKLNSNHLPSIGAGTIQYFNNRLDNNLISDRRQQQINSTASMAMESGQSRSINENKGLTHQQNQKKMNYNNLCESNNSTDRVDNYHKSQQNFVRKKIEGT